MYLVLVVQILQVLPGMFSCPLQCSCSYRSSGDAQIRSVRCSDSGISAVPVNVPADAVKLRLEKTQISQIPRAAFFNLSALRFLWLHYNAIDAVHPSSFVNLKALRELRLDGNLIASFPWEGLRDMPRLQTLSLHNNRLSSIPAHAALFLPNITFLDLSSNRLTVLPAELIDLWFPPPGQQAPLLQRKILGLHDNPWLCDCQVSIVMSLSLSPGSFVVLMDPVLVCSRSVGGSGVLLGQSKLSRCMRPSVLPTATRVSSPLGSNVILRCEATGFPTPTLSWTKSPTLTDCCRNNFFEESKLLPQSLASFMQVSPRVGVRWSIIILNGLSYEDAGEYRCQARNMAGMSEAPIKLKVVGVTQLSRLTKRKFMKAPLKLSTKYKKLSQTAAPSRISNQESQQENQLQNQQVNQQESQQENQQEKQQRKQQNNQIHQNVTHPTASRVANANMESKDLLTERRKKMSFTAADK